MTFPPFRRRATPTQEAAAWLARLHSDDRSAEDENGFRRWIAADPRNGRALEKASTVWDAAGGLAGMAGHADALARPLIARRELVAGAAAALVAGAGTIGWTSARAGVYRTAVGEQRRVALADGSRLMLDTQTELRVHVGSDRRELRLLSGRASLEIAPRSRPFVIAASDRRVVATEGQLDLCCDPNGIAILVAAGRAEMNGGGSRLPLALGDRIRISSLTDGQSVDRPNLDEMLAWQSGRAVFRGTALRNAAEEMNRYNDCKLVIEGDRANAMRLSGVYRVGDTSAFAEAVAMVLPVRVSRTDSQIRIRAL